jgi:hypothetical protein
MYTQHTNIFEEEWPQLDEGITFYFFTLITQHREAKDDLKKGDTNCSVLH